MRPSSLAVTAGLGRVSTNTLTMAQTASSTSPVTITGAVLRHQGAWLRTEMLSPLRVETLDRDIRVASLARRGNTQLVGGIQQPANGRRQLHYSRRLHHSGAGKRNGYVANDSSGSG